MNANRLPAYALRQTLRGLVLGSVLAWVALPAAAASLQDIQRQIKQAQYEPALGNLETYLAARPGDPQARFLKGIALSGMGQRKEAISVFTKLTEDYPELPEPHNNLAVLYGQGQEFEKSRNALERAVRAHPNYILAFENLGDIYAKLAGKSYDRALELGSTNTAIRNKSGFMRDVLSSSVSLGDMPAPKTMASPKAEPKVPATVVASPPEVITRPAPAPAPVAAAPVAAAPVAAAPVAAAPVAAAPVAAAPVAAAPVAAAPVAPAPVVRSEAQGTEPELVQKLADWAAAWSRKDLPAYLAFYAADFSSRKGQGREDWLADRQKKIAERSGSISVVVEGPYKVEINGDRAKITFMQHYKSNTVKESAKKTVVFARKGSQWLIVDESAR